MSDWDELEAVENKPRMQSLAENYEAAKQSYATVKETLDNLEMQIVGEVPEDFGEHEIDAGELTITVRRNDRFAWDQNILAETLEELSDQYPDFVKVSYTIDKKKFNAAPDDVRKPFLHALTRKQGTVNVTIKRKA